MFTQHFICCCSREGAVMIQNKIHHVSGRRCDFIVKGWLRQIKLTWLKLSLLDRNAVWSMLAPLPQQPWGLRGKAFRWGGGGEVCLWMHFSRPCENWLCSSFIPLRPQLVDVWFLLKSYHLGRKSLICSEWSKQWCSNVEFILNCQRIMHTTRKIITFQVGFVG